MSEPEEYEIFWSAVAVTDLDGILRSTVSRHGPGAASRLYDKLREPVKTLTRLPRRCRVVPELQDLGVTEYRELLLRPYRVVFRIYGHQIAIVGVFDGRRDLEEILIARALERGEPA